MDSHTLVHCHPDDTEIAYQLVVIGDVFRCYGSIDAMDSVKVPYVICLTNPIWRHPR